MTTEIHPNFFLVGASKCGTTAMATYLRAHPQIFVPELKEPHFFGSDLEFRRNFARGPEWFQPTAEQYRRFYSEVTVETRSGDASAMYLYSRNAPREIQEFCPRADVLIMLRNPVDMMYSLYCHWLYILNEDIDSFARALAAEEDRKQGLRIPPKAYFAGGLQYREMWRFAAHVERYLEHFGRDRVKILLHDDLKHDPAGMYREVLEFLDVRVDFEPEFTIVNPSMRVRSRALQHFIINLPGLVRWMLKPLVDNWATRRLLERTAQLINIQRTPRPPMDPQLRAMLQRELAPDVAALSDLLDRDLTHWSRE